jgi:hypothetical protein
VPAIVSSLWIKPSRLFSVGDVGRDGLAESSQEQVHLGGIEPGHHQGDTGSRAGHTAPTIQADWCPTSRNRRGVWPRCHQPVRPFLADPPLPECSAVQRKGLL